MNSPNLITALTVWEKVMQESNDQTQRASWFQLSRKARYQLENNQPLSQQSKATIAEMLESYEDWKETPESVKTRLNAANEEAKALGVYA